MTGPAPRLVVYMRTYCHLCEDMLQGLVPYQRRHGLRIETVDVDSDPALEVLYGEKVPVLIADGRELCHYFLDTAALEAWLAAVPR